MKILAVETSSELCSVALWLEGELVTREAAAGQRHSELLLPMVDELLKSRELELKQLDAIAFGAGPGSFTGVRIACGVVQGLALGADLPVAPIGTLLALAQSSGAQRAVCILDARMGEIYHAAYENRSGLWYTVYEPSLCKPEEAPVLESFKWTACGNGFTLYRDVLSVRYAGRLERIMDNLVPHAKDIAALAVKEFEQGNTVVADAATPVYVRNKVALRSDER